MDRNHRKRRPRNNGHSGAGPRLPTRRNLGRLRARSSALGERTLGVVIDPAVDCLEIGAAALPVAQVLLGSNRDFVASCLLASG